MQPATSPHNSITIEIALTHAGSVSGPSATSVLKTLTIGSVRTSGVVGFRSNMQMLVADEIARMNQVQKRVTVL